MRRMRWKCLAAVCILAWCIGVSAEPTTFRDVWRENLPQVTKVKESPYGPDRKVIRYEHPCRKEWGFADDSATEHFLLVTPARKTESPPLYVYLHAAGGKPHASVPRWLGPEFVALYPDSGQSKEHPAWWWGYRNEIKKAPERYRDTYSPSENRILATIEWAVREFNVDRNRIYLMGYSMGGSGSLGLGMRRGDLFAALWVGVPAGIDHVNYRMGFPAKIPADGPDDPAYRRSVSGVGLPDAPPIVSFISQTDGWCRQQEDFIRTCQDGRHLMILAWGPYGHSRDYSVTDGAARDFPWTEIRRDEAYPVFTHADSDDTYPGYKGEGPDQVGQKNAFFRWKVREDAEGRFAIDLWLVNPESVSKPTRVPEKSTVDVTPRRLQRFHIKPKQVVRWQLLAADKPVADGDAKVDDLGLLTVPRVTITRQVRTLVLTPR